MLDKILAGMSLMDEAPNVGGSGTCPFAPWVPANPLHVANAVPARRGSSPRHFHLPFGRAFPDTVRHDRRSSHLPDF
jgi:hypothetical protein